MFIFTIIKWNTTVKKRMNFKRDKGDGRVTNVDVDKVLA